MVLPNFGSGIAAKQYDPGAPFFLGLLAIGYAEAQKTLLGHRGGSLVRGVANSQVALYLLGLPGGVSLLNTALFFSI
jgi:hypothetical protein